MPLGRAETLGNLIFAIELCPWSFNEEYNVQLSPFGFSKVLEANHRGLCTWPLTINVYSQPFWGYIIFSLAYFFEFFSLALCRNHGIPAAQHPYLL